MNTPKKSLRSPALQWMLLVLVAAALGAVLYACKSDDSTPTQNEPDLVAPFAPSSVTLVPVSTSIVRLVWTESEKRTYTGFLIQRKQGAAGEWKDLAKVNAAYRVYTDSNLIVDQYSYRIITLNVTAMSRPSFEVTVNTATVVIAPTKLAVSNVSVGHVELRWTDNSNNETGFYIQRTVIGGSGSPTEIHMDTILAGQSSFIDDSAPCGTLLAYRVRAFSPVQESNYSTPVTVSVPYTTPFSITTGVRSELMAVSNISSRSAIAVGASGTVLRTDDGGDSWIKLKTGFSSTYNAVQCINANTYYIAGDRGRIIRTDDAGNIWYPRMSGKTAAIYSMWFFSPDTGYVCGENGALMVTKDGGLNWTSISSGTAGDLRCITFTSRLVGYCVGDNGVVLRTMNGGQNWGILRTGIGNILYSTSFFNDSLGYVVGSRGVILRTTDMGVTWVSQSNPYGSDVLCVKFPARDRVLVSGVQTDLLFTVNDGRSWVKIPIASTTTRLNGFTFNSDGTGIMVGSNGSAWVLQGCR